MSIFINFFIILTLLISCTPQVEVNLNDFISGGQAGAPSSSDDGSSSSGGQTEPSFGDFNYLITTPKNLVINPLNINDAYFYDNDALTLFYVNLLTGATAEVSNANRGAGDIIKAANSMAIDFSSSLAYIITSTEIYSINLINGNRSLLASNSVGAGATINDLLGIQVNNTGDKLYVTNSKTDGEILEVNTSNGNRTIISNSLNGSGTNLRDVDEIILSSDSSKAYVACKYGSPSYTLYFSEVDLLTGNRTIISDDSTGTGPSLQRIEGMNIYGTNLRVISYFSNEIIDIDINTGDRTSLTTLDTRYSGPTVSLSNINTNYLTKKYFPSIFNYDLVSDSQTELVTGATGTYPHYGTPQGLAVTKDETKVYFIGGAFPQINMFNTITKETSVISNNTNSGPTISDFLMPLLLLSADEKNLYLIEQNDELVMSIDISTGNRTLIIDGLAGISLGNVTGFSRSSDDKTLYILSKTDNALYSVDIASQVVTELSSNSTVGTGDNFTNPSGLAVTDDNGTR